MQKEEIDEHNQPTEPMARLVLPAYTPTTPQATPSLDEPTIAAQPIPAAQPAPTIPPQVLVWPAMPPMPQVQYPPQPLSPVQAYNPYHPAPAGTYPVLPLAPTQQQAIVPSVRGDRVGAGGAQPQGVSAPAKGSRKQHRFGLPLYVGMFFVTVQFLLLARFVVNLLNLPVDNVWRDIIVTFSDVFLLPFYLLFRQMALPAPAGAELYTLLAVLIYGVVSRILVRLLKTVLHAQQARKA